MGEFRNWSAPPARRRFLLNSPVLTDYGHWRMTGPIDLAAARRLLREMPWESAIGHASTAAHLQRLLGTSVPCVRRAIRMAPGDDALVFRLLDRPFEGLVLEEAALATAPAEFALLVRLE